MKKYASETQYTYKWAENIYLAHGEKRSEDYLLADRREKAGFSSKLT